MSLSTIVPPVAPMIPPSPITPTDQPIASAVANPVVLAIRLITSAKDSPDSLSADSIFTGVGTEAMRIFINLLAFTSAFLRPAARPPKRSRQIYKRENSKRRVMRSEREIPAEARIIYQSAIRLIVLAVSVLSLRGGMALDRKSVV